MYYNSIHIILSMSYSSVLYCIVSYDTVVLCHVVLM